jgi:hypothetical protein
MKKKPPPLAFARCGLRRDVRDAIEYLLSELRCSCVPRHQTDPVRRRQAKATLRDFAAFLKKRAVWICFVFFDAV